MSRSMTKSMQSTADREAALLQDGPDPEKFLQLGIMYSTGKSVPTDMVVAHKWLNLAGMHGSSEARTLRCEIASEMSSNEIAAAQRAARAWLTRH
ncbi:MAG: hypothetical protein ABSE22_05000 [Xanthobacteraceae bacterium]|jgi:TPR repeat protein